MSDNLNKVWNTLRSSGYDVVDYDEFARDMQDDGNLGRVRETLIREGYDTPDFDKFKSEMFGASGSDNDPAEGATGPIEQPATPEVSKPIAGDDNKALARMRKAQEGHTVIDEGVEKLKGFAPAIKQGTINLAQGIRNLAGEAVNELGGTSADAKEQLSEIERRKAEGQPMEFEQSESVYEAYKKALDKPGLTEEERADIIKQMRRTAINAAMPAMFKVLGFKALGSSKNTIEQEVRHRNKLNEDLQRRIEANDGDIDKVAAELEEKAGEESWGEKQSRQASEAMAAALPTKGVGAFAGTMLPQMVGPAMTIGLGLATKGAAPGLVDAVGKLTLAGLSASTAGASMAEAKRYGATDEQAWAVGMADAAIECITEKIPLDLRYLKRIKSAGKANISKGLQEAIATDEGGREFAKMLNEANRKLGGKFFSAHNAKEFGLDLFTEGSSEFLAEFGETLTPIIYERPEDYPTLTEAISNGIEGFKGGLFMGGVLGGMSMGAAHKINNQRRKEQGYVDAAYIDFGQNGKDDVQIAEVVGRDETGKYIVQKGNETQAVDESQIIESARFTYDEFKRGELEFAGDMAFDEGYQLQDPGEMAKATKRFEAYRTKVAQQLGMTEEELDEVDAANETQMSGAFYGKQAAEGEERGENNLADFANRQYELYLNYVRARASYNGMISAAQDKIATQTDELNKSVDARTNPDTGTIQTVTLKPTNGQESGELAHIVRGTLVVNPDGTINKTASGDLYILKGEGQEPALISADEIESADPAIDPGQEKAEGAENIANTIADETEAAMSGRLDFNVGESFEFDDGTVGQILQTGGNNLVVLVADESGETRQIPVPIKTVQDVADAKALAEANAEIDALEYVEERGAYRNNEPVVIDLGDGEYRAATISPATYEPGMYEVLFNEATPSGETISLMSEDELNSVVRVRDGKEIKPVQPAQKWEPVQPKKRVAPITPQEMADKDAIGSVRGLPFRAGDNDYRLLRINDLYRDDSGELMAKVMHEGDIDELTVPFGILQRAYEDWQTPKDYLGNKLPLDADGNVDEAKLFETSPEAWARWNDKERGDGGTNSANLISKYAQSAQRALDKLKGKYDEEMDFGKRRQLETQITEHQKLIDKYSAIINGYKTKEMGLNEPKTLEQLVSSVMKDMYQKGDLKHGISREDFIRETGYNGTELKKYFPLLGKGGMTITALAEYIAADYNHTGLIPYAENGDADTQAVRNAIINLLTSNETPSEIFGLTRAENVEQEKGFEAQDDTSYRTPSISADVISEAARLTKLYGDRVHFITKASQVTNAYAMEAINLRERVRGWFDTGTGEAYIYLPAIGSAKELRQVVTHEVLVHKGLRELMGEQRYTELCKRVYNDMMTEGERQYFLQRYNGNMSEEAAGDEYLAHIAQAIDLTAAKEKSFWGKILDKIKSIFGKSEDVDLTYNDDYVAGLIRASYANMIRDVNIKESYQAMQEFVDRFNESMPVDVAERVAQAEAEVNTNPTDAQKEAGNYKKGHLSLDGFDISIENPKGSVRSGVDRKGNRWETTMRNTYGYIRGRKTVDGDDIDVFLSDNPTDGYVFVVDQINPETGEFDEHKVMYGFNSEEEARAAYLSNYEEGWQGLGNITGVSKDDFKKWVESSKRKTKPFAEYAVAKEKDLQETERLEDMPEFENEQIEKVAKETGADASNVFPRQNEIRFSKQNANQEMFVSNAQQAVESIDMGKASGEQWIKAIQGKGGLKAGEDKWLGLSQWLSEQTKPVTKDDVLGFIEENRIQIEEVHYGYNDADFDKLNDEFKQKRSEIESLFNMDEKEAQGGDLSQVVTWQQLHDTPESELEQVMDDVALEELASDYNGGDDFKMAFEVIDGELAIGDDDRAAFFLGDANAINNTRLQYTTPDLNNKREIALTVPTIESWAENDEVHFGDADEGRAIAWARFGDTKDSDGNKVLAIDEIQSNRHQEGREKGYGITDSEAESRYFEFINRMRDKYGFHEWQTSLTSEESEEYSKVLNDKNSVKELVPPAPFEKNWHELTFKRMLRLAAEEGYDRVAWTSGDMQADRYDLSKSVDEIRVIDAGNGEHEVRGFKDGENIINEQTNGGEKGLAELIGKDLARKAYASLHEGDETYLVDNTYASFEGDNLKVGGQGMSGFYDEIIPRFVDKYCKKWGVKTQDIELPVGEGLWHSVEVTPEMKESVMQGQTMFSKVTPEMDAEYLSAVGAGDMEKAQKMVDEAARKAGYATPILYHGTGKFGFTSFDSKRKSGAIFTTSARNVAANYAGDNNYASPRMIAKKYKEPRTIQDTIENAKSVFNQNYRIATNEERKAVIDDVTTRAKQVANKINSLMTNVTYGEGSLGDDFAWASNIIYDAADALDNGNSRKAVSDFLKTDYERFKESRPNIRDYTGELSKEEKDLADYLCGYEVGDLAIDAGLSMMKALSDGDILTVDGKQFLLPDEANEAIARAKDIGAYSLYGNLGDNPLEIDANGKVWYGLDYNGISNTDDVAKWAKDNGYTSVVVKSVFDYGDKADDYIFFNPEQIKSADPVTYDDNGNVIPLSERFNEKESDIRFSKLSSSDLRNLSKEISKEQYERFSKEVYRENEKAREEINRIASGMDWDFEKATRQYLSDLSDVWELKDYQQSIIDKARNAFGEGLSNEEVKYILWSKGDREKGVFGAADDVVMQRSLGVGDYINKKNDGQQRIDNSGNQTGIRFGNGEASWARALLRNNEGAGKSAGGKYEYPPIEDDLPNGAKLSGQQNKGASGIRFSKAQSIYEEKNRVIDKNGEKKSSANLARRVFEGYWDSMKALQDAQDAVAEETGKPIKDFENAYFAENAMSSVNLEEAKAYERDYVAPIAEELEKLYKAGVKHESIIEYLIAKHGLERNRVMQQRAEQKLRAEWQQKIDAIPDDAKDRSQKIAELAELYNEKFRKTHHDYAGLSALTESKSDYTALAQDIVSRFESEHETDALWKTIRRATQNTLLNTYNAGLMTDEQYKEIATMYEYYIPLRGWNDGTVRDIYNYLQSSEPLREKVMKAATGRTSIAEDPIAEIQKMAYDGIVSANRNRMKQKFLNMVLNHPTDLFAVSEQWYTKNAATGEWDAASPDIQENDSPARIKQKIDAFEEQMKAAAAEGNAKKQRGKLVLGKHATSYEKREHETHIFRNGKEYVVYVCGNPRVMQALDGLTNPNSDDSAAIKKMQEVKNFMSQAFTSKNVAFILKNLARDTMFSGFSVFAKENGAYLKQYNANYGKSLIGTAGLIRKANNGTLDESVPIERYFHEFLKGGGETGYTNAVSIDTYKKRMKEFEEKITASGMKKAKSVPKDALFAALDCIEYLNRCAEDVTRFAVYMTSRQMGRTVARSIWDAKNVTVNFNKKGSGEYGAKWCNFAYIFFNACLQSAANITRIVKENPKKGIVGLSGMLAAGCLVPVITLMAQAMLGYGDGDDEMSYWDLPEWVRRNNLVFWIPGTNAYFTFPIAQELRPLYNIGEIVSSAMFGKENVEDGIKKGVEGLTTLLPVDVTGNGGNQLVNFTPTAFQPVAQIVANKDFFGTPIYKGGEYNKDNPEWTKAYKGTSGWLVDGTKWLNGISGGNEVDKGWMNFNPAIIEHLFESYLGGSGKTFNQFCKTISSLWSDDELMMRNVPVASSFVQAVDERQTGSQTGREYYELYDEYKEAQRRFNGYKAQLKREGGVRAEEYAGRIAEYTKTDEFKRYRKMKKYVDKINDLNSRKKNLPQDKADELELKILELKRKMVEEMKEE